jgi:hypothetical protein
VRNVLAFLGAGLMAAACAGPETTAARESPTDREYPTGSNIPKKAAQRDPSAEGVHVLTRDALERVQNSGNGAPTRGSGLSP